MCIRNKPNNRHKNYQTDLAKYLDIYLQTKHYILDKNDLLMFLKLDFKTIDSALRSPQLNIPDSRPQSVNNHLVWSPTLD